MKKKNSVRPYLATFLSESKAPMEVYLAGIRHETIMPIHLLEDGFNWTKARKVSGIHCCGPVFIHGTYGYILNGYLAYRFKILDLVIISN